MLFFRVIAVICAVFVGITSAQESDCTNSTTCSACVQQRGSSCAWCIRNGTGSCVLSSQQLEIPCESLLTGQVSGSIVCFTRGNILHSFGLVRLLPPIFIAHPLHSSLLSSFHRSDSSSAALLWHAGAGIDAKKPALATTRWPHGRRETILRHRKKRVSTRLRETTGHRFYYACRW
jgi:hypothetical protein